MKGQHMLRLEARGHSSQLLKTPQQQSGAGQQHHGQSDLNSHQCELNWIATGDLRAARLRQVAGQNAACGADRGKYSTEQSGRDRAGQRIEHDAPIEPDLFVPRQIFGQGAEHSRRFPCDRQTESGPRDRQNQNLG